MEVVSSGRPQRQQQMAANRRSLDRDMNGAGGSLDRASRIEANGRSNRRKSRASREAKPPPPPGGESGGGANTAVAGDMLDSLVGGLTNAADTPAARRAAMMNRDVGETKKGQEARYAQLVRDAWEMEFQAGVWFWHNPLTGVSQVRDDHRPLRSRREMPPLFPLQPRAAISPVSRVRDASTTHPSSKQRGSDRLCPSLRP